MDNTTFESSSVNSALTRIKNTLNYSLKENYGIEDPEITEKFLHLHGLDKSRFDFINNFETLIEKGIADESVDTNANKSDKSITGFFVEASLPIKKLVGYRYLYRKLKELYGKKEAKRLSGEMYDMSLALADSTNILSPYSYYGNTPIYIKINNEEYYMTLKQLFERFQKYSQYDEEYDMDVIYTDDIKQDVLIHKSFMMNNENRGRNAAYTKSTKDLEKLNENILCQEDVDIKVWDDENGFVNISRIVRHKNDKDMIIYATEDGDFAFVTPDHPVILEDDSEVTAENLTTGMRIKDAQLSNPVPSRANTIYVPEKFAYFLGFILGDGNLQGYDQDPDYIDNPVGCVKFVRGGNLVSIYQKDIENSKIYSIAKELFPDAKFFKYHNDDAINPMTGKPYSNNDRKINFTSWALNSLCSYYFEYGRRENSFTKKLPKNIFNWKRESIEAFIAGLLDADGIVYKSNGACEISMKSVASINGIYELLLMLGTKAHKKLRGCNNDDIMFSVSFRPTEKIYEWSEKLGQVEFNKVFDDYGSKYDTRPRSNKISKIIKISKKNENVKYKDSAFYDELEYVYDITTDTGRFVANGMVQHNCFSINASKLVMEGRPFGSLPSGVPHRVISYINALCETIHQLSNHLAGAIAAGSLFLDIAHVMIYREHKTLTDLKNSKYRKYIENSLQAFVHSVNMLSRNAVESPFTNVSVFDRVKLKALIDDDNMGWYFDKEDILDGTPDSALADCGDRDWHDYICDVILELEDIFMDVMDNGDPLHDHRVIEFPVVTFNISRKKNDDATYAFEDPEWVKSFCEKHDIYRYNIYVSEGMKVASCCFAPNTPLTFINSDGEVSTMNIGDYVETRLDEELGNKDYVQKTLPGDEFINTRHGQIIPITGVIKLQNKWKRLLKITFTSGDEIWCTPDQKFLLLNEELAEAKDLTEGSLLYRYLEVKSVDSYESDEPVYDIEVGSEDHIFKIKLPSGHSLRVSNCRLVNDNELFELGGQVNSFGGSALSLGSHRVCTVNMRRISLECNSYEDYKERLGKRMDDAAKILLAHRSLIKDMIDKGTQPFFDNGWLDLDRMFSTIGILGYYEANEDLRKKFGGDDYLDDLVSFIDQKARELTVSLHNIYNVEQIPAESQAVKAAKVDKWLFGEEKVSENIYANQFVPLWEDVTLKEKFEREGDLASRLTGGGIIHFSLGEKVTPKQAYSIIESATAHGCDYFALNANYAVCENDHYTFGKHDFCPKCLQETGKKVPIISNLTRVVGFYTFTANWSTEKREYDYDRRHFRGVEG